MNDLLLVVSILINIFVLIMIVSKKEKIDMRGIEKNLISLEKNTERIEKLVNEEMGRNREENSKNLRDAREEQSEYLNKFNLSITYSMGEISKMQKAQLDSLMKQLQSLSESNENKLQQMRDTIEERLVLLQKDNNEKLEKMRETVDEKLHSTLEKRLGESFKLVSDRLELVHKGLGEMQNLATGVGDLKKVLTNVKTRGTWGEVQLANLLEQILTKEQYCENVATKKDSLDRVEFAIKLPAKDEKSGIIYMPIDSKFPLEDYQRLVDAQDEGKIELVEEYSKALELRIKSEAKDIRNKYIDPPNTTDFGILFLPVEGLYAEVIRKPGLCEFLQREYRIVITGPTTLAALLNSLQMGFKTLAIEKRSSDVWQLLGVVKTEFGKFGDLLDKTQKKLQEASNSIEKAAQKSRGIEKKLGKVQEMPTLNEDNQDNFIE